MYFPPSVQLHCQALILSAAQGQVTESWFGAEIIQTGQILPKLLPMNCLGAFSRNIQNTVIINVKAS